MGLEEKFNDDADSDLKTRRALDAGTISRKMHGLGVVLFICLSITVGVLTVCLTNPKSIKMCNYDFTRILPSSLAFSSQPRSVAVGDFNNDQKIDIVIVNSDTDTIGILISKGQGTFAEQQTYSTGLESQPYSVVVNDFNNDTYADISVANYGTNNMGIFLGNGNGTFNDQNIFSLGSSRPIFITTGDFNKDNRIDIACVNYGVYSIGILLGYGNGSFESQTTYSTGYDSFPSSLVVADFNKDHHVDIAVANYGTDNIGIFLNYGNGTFTNQETYTTVSKSNPSSITVGDFNNDDKLDIAVSNNGTGNVGIFLGYGNGSFQAQTIYSIGSKSHPQYITIGDLNNDNELDIVVADSENDEVHILPGYGNGRFSSVTTYDTVSGSRPMYVAVADFQNNNKSDIAIVNYDTNNVLVLTNYSINPSVRQTNYYTMTDLNIVAVAVGDFNSDHIYDIVFLSLDQLHLRFGLGNGTFGSDISYSIGSIHGAQYICVEDLNNDMKMDIVVAGGTSSNSVGVVLGLGDGTFGNIKVYPTGNSSGPWWVAVGDVNNDGRLDLVSANTGTDNIGILLGNGDGTFATMTAYSLTSGSKPYSVAIGDLNNDHYLDLVVGTGNGYLVVFQGFGNGSFPISTMQPMVQYALSFAVALGDFNGDNYPDIVVVCPFINSIGIFIGNGTYRFATPTLYSTGSISRPYDVIVADLNNDNISDVAVTNNGNDQVVIFYSNRNGSLELRRTYSTGDGSMPYSIVAADLDNNKQLEIIVALSGIKRIAVLTEYQEAVFSNQTKYLTGSAPQPYSVAVGDFNNDDRSDIVVANSGTDNLGILLRFDNSTFDMNMKYQIGTDSYPRYVITCDVNNDDKLDIVSVNSKMNSISVIMGYGNGTFAEQLIYSTGNDSYPIAVAAGHLNNDNHLDLVVANEGTSSAGIFYGFDYIIFQSQNIYSSNDSLQPIGIDVRDLNNDNYLDVVATFYVSNKIGVLLGCGDGTFTTMSTYSTGQNSKPWGIVINDFNDDDQYDIVVANSATNNIGIFLGYGNGSFTDIILYSTEENSGPQGVTVGDFNNDSRLDIVVANFGSNSVGVLLGYGNGSFSNIAIYSTGAGSRSWSVTSGDFNNDDNLDIAVANYGTQNVGILLGFGNGTFQNQVIFPTGSSSYPTALTVGDFNSDNQLDFAVGDYARSQITIFLGYGNGTFATMRAYSTGFGSTPRYISVGDFNNDNISDIAVTNFGTSSIVVLFGFGDGSFLLGQAHSTGPGSVPYALAIGDFNKDSRLDIAVTNLATNNIGIFISYDSQPFAEQSTWILDDGSKPHFVAIDDLDHDSCMDIIVVNYGTNNLEILFGNGAGDFQIQSKYSTGNDSSPTSVAIADFNNDNHLDIVVTNSETNNILILLGYSNRTFIIGLKYSTGARSQPYAVATGDLNNDNVSDIVVANTGTNNILLIYGYGNGTFGNETSYVLGYKYNPSSIAIQKSDQRNELIIVIACYGTNHVEILIKECD